MPQELKYRLTTEGMDHKQAQPSLQDASQPGWQQLLFPMRTVTNSESSCMGPFQEQMSVISRIGDKYNYSICNMMWTPQGKAGRVDL